MADDQTRHRSTSCSIHEVAFAGVGSQCTSTTGLTHLPPDSNSSLATVLCGTELPSPTLSLVQTHTGSTFFSHLRYVQRSHTISTMGSVTDTLLEPSSDTLPIIDRLLLEASEIRNSRYIWQQFTVEKTGNLEFEMSQLLAVTWIQHVPVIRM